MSGHDHDQYPILLSWDEPDKVWVADVPDVRYCSASGPTPEAALHEVQAALAEARERGIPVPPPTTRPVLARAS